jgi:transcriptional regulator with XRE-family HTH domain
MTPRGVPEPATDPVRRSAARLAAEIGAEIREARHRRRWSMRELGARCGLTGSAIQKMEAGEAGSVEAYARVGAALSLRPELHLVDERQRRPVRDEDPVHAWMGDAEASQLQGHGLPVAIDEPYQHFQFAGRADLVAWSIDQRALLHIENRTRFPNLQEAAGSFNAKRSYLAPAIADRLRLRGGFRSVTHVIAGLWSAELQHLLRLRTATFRALCPDGPDGFAAWWDGRVPDAGVSATFVLFDPAARPRARRWVDLADALRVDARYRGYADAVGQMAGGAHPPRR